MVNLRSTRKSLGISQSKLARLSCVSRFKICMFELGDGALTTTEQLQIMTALEAETARLRSVALDIDLHGLEFAGGK
jgi:predicted transcriptional regulator